MGKASERSLSIGDFGKCGSVGVTRRRHRSRNSGGSGLGLAIAQAIIHAHQGKLNI
ncbi:hypothetical protein [uncultured Nostoc sp.]|uniref:hypothetical protein n=1 Tax=uncultured Nostoc sp. TaxID=340711 RepID=UPI0035CAA88F